MGTQDTKIQINNVEYGSIMAYPPPQINKFSAPFRKFSHQTQSRTQNKITTMVRIQSPEQQNISVSQAVFEDVEEAFYRKTRDVQFETVLFDEQYLDHCTYLVKRKKKSYALQLRPFSSYKTQTFNNILCELHILKQVTKLNCKNLNGFVDAYIVETGLQTEGEDFPNTQVFVLQHIAMNLSQMIKFRRQNNWLWSVEEFDSFARDLVTGLLTLHQAGISHNDIRPCNIFYSLQKNCYQIGTFANALKTSEGSANTGIKVLKNFSDPDLGKTKNENLFYSDIYSLGITLLCTFCLCEPINLEGLEPYNEELEEKYSILRVIRKMLLPIGKRKRLDELLREIGEGRVNKKIKNIIESSKFKNSRKQANIIRTYKYLADAYERLGLWNEWKEAFEEAYSRQQYKLDDHFKADAYFQLSKIQLCRGNERDSYDLAKKASLTFRNLGDTATYYEKIDEAINCYAKAITCLKYLKDENDLDMVINLQKLSEAHAERGDYELSRPLMSEAVVVVGKLKGKKSNDYVKVRMSQANLEANFGEFDKSQKILMECLRIVDKEEMTEEEKKFKATIYQQIGKNYLTQSTYKTERKEELLKISQEHITKALNINESYPDNHFALSVNVETIGEIKIGRQKFKQAIKNFKKAQSMRRKHYNIKKTQQQRMNKYKANILCFLGFCQTCLEEHEEALENYEQALAIYKDIFGSNHNKSSAIAIGKMSRVYYNMGQVKKAKDCVRLAWSILLEVGGSNDGDYIYYKKLEEKIQI